MATLVASSSFAAVRPSFTLPTFLVPAFASRPALVSTRCLARPLSSTPHCSAKNAKRRNPNRNKLRGVSAIRMTGPRVPFSIAKYPLPRPSAGPGKEDVVAPEYVGSEDHGLWGFFNAERAPMIKPDEESEHGRAWTYKELSNKSFSDLHKLYWVCIKEVNLVQTRTKEARRVAAGYGQSEGNARVKEARKTMIGIRQVLRDRQLSFEQAQAILESRDFLEIFPDRATQKEYFDGDDDTSVSTNGSVPTSPGQEIRT